jgi:C1A family cysteine protease
VDFQLASSVNYVSQLPAAKSQGDRGTCVAFAVTAINEFYFSRKNGFYTDLSEQYLFSETKKLEGDNNCSSHIAKALNVLSNSGQCPESVWSYNPNAPCIQQDGEPSNADQYAIPYRNGYVPYNVGSDLILQLKSSLTIGQLIAFSIPVFRSWYRNDETVSSGRIIMPLTNEPVMLDGAGNEEGHAMAIIGYQDSAEYPGGGYFIIRNSWGPQLWGTHNIYGAGYGTIPYQYISDFHWEVYGI